MKNIYLIIIVLLIFSCSQKNKDENLFLDFPSGITKEKFIAQAKENTDLVVKNENFPEYEYQIFLKSTSIKTELKAIFDYQSGKLYQIFISGEAQSNSQLIEIENMLLEKYKEPKRSDEYNNIEMSKIPCYTWALGNKEIRFCRDSFPDHSLKVLSSIQDRIDGKPTIIDTTQKKLLYFFEIYYTDKKIENAELNKKTKEEL